MTPNTAADGPRLASEVPRLPLVAMALLVVVSLVGVTAVRLSGHGGTHQADATTVGERSLRFEDQSDGSIVILDARTGGALDTVAPGTNGFLRSTMRSLVRERKRQGLGPETPFQLLARADGRLTLLDPSTGRRIDLESFGPTNSAVFLRLLPGTPPAPALP